MLYPRRTTLLAPAACALLVLAGAWVALRSKGMGTAQSNADKGTAAAAAQGSGGGVPEKVGAGLLLTCDGQILLLQRAGKHNMGTWGLPGGNADAGDVDLLATARREAGEEMGPGVPPFEVVGELLTRRGKRLQKHYTVFIARIQPEDRAAWQPQLNQEHSAWRWFSLAQLQAANSAPALHPVVQLALHSSPHRQAVLAAVGAGGGAARGAGGGGQAAGGEP